ncbi:MAG TPA: thiol:disulfide interchange protein DsbA/DsbL [Luteibacter sp.]|uniref:thiol:disulfide interchange protein DsbA/DsbL n=1 Tax=Luteibacter sp. TaxID=1886636 RepID=UPI002B558B41|nr:thiol:disulfide interchange protein DsbA/DsbL [Luteibacter sp.]HVI56964.1 thiol:disulfide interchange protein DsbA/DsbL [Luteibacter sp.]
MFKRLSLLFVGLTLATACSAGPADPATDPYAGKYDTIATPQRLDPKDGKVEVVEVFSYGCIHCAHFEPTVEELQKKLPKGVAFHVVPAAFNDNWLPYAQAYYAAQKLKVDPAAHAALFKAIHTDHYPLRSIEELADWYATNYHLDKAKFLEAATKDKAIHDRILADTKLIQQWGVDGTPAIVVDGKYRPKDFKDFDELNAMTLSLVDKELKGGK